MSRIWTLKELNDVHPLSDGLHWHDDGDGTWSAQPDDDDRSGDYSCFVWIDGDRTVLVSDGTSPEVALSVALVHLGLDSLAAMAGECEREARLLCPPFAGDPSASRWANHGRAAIRRMGAMLSRGTVQP